MELKVGYKQTDAGVIHEDWDVFPLGRLIASVEYGSSAKSSSAGFMPVLRMGNLQGGKIDWSDLVFTNDQKEADKYLLRVGDVLFNRTNTIDLVGKTSIYLGEQPAIFAGYLIRINVNPDLLDQRFLNYALNTELAKKYGLKVLSVAVGQANINGQKLKTYPIPLPPTIAEQSAIANALSDVDELMAAQVALVAKKRAIKQGAMQELLTGKRRLPGFVKDWELKELGEIAAMGSGGTPNSAVRSYYGGDIPWVSIADMTMSGKVIESTQQTLTPHGLQYSAAKLFPSGTVLYAMYASLGECSIAGVEVSSSQAILGIQPKPKVSNHFLYYYLTSIRSRVKTLGQQGTQANLNKGMVKKFQIFLPSIEEQSAIAQVFDDMDAEINALEAKLEKIILLKKGMMQELLTGKTRLV